MTCVPVWRVTGAAVLPHLPWDCWEGWRRGQLMLHWLSETWHTIKGWKYLQQRVISISNMDVFVRSVPLSWHKGLFWICAVTATMFFSILGKIGSSVPLAVCSRVQGPAGWSRRPLFSNTQNFEAFSLRTTATVACQHRRVNTLSGRVCWGTSL